MGDEKNMELDDITVGKRAKKLYETLKSSPIGSHSYLAEILSGVKTLMGSEEDFQTGLNSIRRAQEAHRKFYIEFEIDMETHEDDSDEEF